jgi:hypothetical protein
MTTWALFLLLPWPWRLLSDAQLSQVAEALRKKPSLCCYQWLPLTAVIITLSGKALSGFSVSIFCPTLPLSFICLCPLPS